MRKIPCGILCVFLLGACSSGEHKSAQRQNTAPAPWSICGQNIRLTIAGWYVEDASQHDLQVTRRSAGELVYLQFSHDCKAKVDYKVVPPGAATVVTQVPATNPVAVILHPAAPTFVVNFQRPSGPGHVNVDFAQPTTSLPS